MLELRPNCECCDKDLPADQVGAMICSFECTFCEECTDTKLAGKCPNCGGQLVPRPLRQGKALAANPASDKRIFKEEGCN